MRGTQRMDSSFRRLCCCSASTSKISDPDRCVEAGIPENRCRRGLLTKPRPAEAMIARTLDAGVVAGWGADGLLVETRSNKHTGGQQISPHQ